MVSPPRRRSSSHQSQRTLPNCRFLRQPAQHLRVGARRRAVGWRNRCASPPVEDCPPLLANHAPPNNEPDSLALMRTSYHNTKMSPVGNFDAKKWREYRWAYYSAIEKVDALIGPVLRPLDETGQEDRTVLVFLSDHGRQPGCPSVEPEDCLLLGVRSRSARPEL
ncbi:MAG: sulfatase-like hydrolase/transferase [Bryobacteraceae bacterium]